MRHQKSGKKLGRTSAHRHAMFANMVSSLLIHERIETTEAKAKELRRFADWAISWGTSVNELAAKGRDKLTSDEKAAIVHAMRQARRVLKSEEAVEKLFHEVAPRFRGRQGGYTRVLKTRVRIGDAAPMAFVELTERAAVEEPAPAPESAPAKGKGAKAKGAAPAKAAAAAPAKSAKAKGEKAEAGEKAEKAPKKPKGETKKK
jgi:large subunit ribosomal protein L17